MRCFIAIPLPGNIKQALSQIQSQLKTTEAHVKWVKSENIHLTLKFLGNIKDEEVGEISRNLKDAFREFQSFESSLGELGTFPTISNPRVIWLGIDKNADKITQLQQKTEDILYNLGFNKEKRKFHPHLTLGRVKSKKNINKLIDMVKNFPLENSQTFRVDKIILFQSILKPSGAEYTALNSFKLSG